MPLSSRTMFLRMISPFGEIVTFAKKSAIATESISTRKGSFTNLMPPTSNLRQRRRSVALALSKKLKLENPLLPLNTNFKGSPSAITLPWKDTSPRVSNAFNWSPAQPCSDTRSISFASISKSNANGAQAREPFVSRLPR